MAQQIDIIELLERDHRRINDLVEQLEEAEDPGEIRALYLRIVDELSAHEAIEQQVVFPAFHTAFAADADNTLAHRMGEHEEMNEMLVEMRSLAPNGFAFIKRGSALLLEIKSHFLIEEETVFARMKQGFAADELVELAREALIHA
jgi:iron-sulfur cluster repair protein YtfE (RIC family)